MKKVKFLLFLSCLFLGLIWQQAAGQTPGLIYKPSNTPLGRSVMDPNLDGWSSPTSAGFIDTDYGIGSELRMIAVPQLMEEPFGDPITGGTGGHTDVVSVDGGNSVFVLKKEVDGVDYFIIRFRIGKASTARKGYSLLIDTDNDFSGTGSNPGFEKEIVLETGVGVKVYTHNVSAGTSTNISYNIDEYHQRSIALSFNNGDPDYFYDFFVPYADLGIPAGTQVRFVATTITSAQSGISGTSSDVNGIDDKLYGGNTLAIYTSLINSFPPVDLDNLEEGGSFGQVLSFPPTVNSPISSNSTIITGTSQEQNGTVITIFKNGVFYGSASVTNNSWTLSGVSGLTVGDIITAKATGSGKGESGVSNSVEVGPVQSCFLPAPVITSRNNGAQTLSGTWSNGQTITANTIRIRAYQQTAGTNTFTELNAATIQYVATDGTFTFISGLAQNAFNSASIVVRAETLSCISDYSNIILGNTGTITTAPSVLTTSVLESNSPTNIEVRNLATYNAVVSLYINGNEVFSSGTLAQNAIHIFSVPVLLEGDRIYAKSLGVGSYFISNASNQVIVQSNAAPSTAPSITGTYIAGTNQTVSGTSSELPGTIIYIYKAGNVLLGSAIVNAFGLWEIEGLTLVTGDVITAKADASGKSVSEPSPSVTVAAGKPAAPILTGTVQAGQTSLSGSNGNGIITIYVDGDPIGTTTGSSWSLIGINSLDIFKGAEIYATNTVNSIESDPSNIVTASGVESFLISDPSGAPVNNQIAGDPFDIRVVAKDQLNGAGNTVNTFTSKVTIASSSNVLTGGGLSPTFTAGELTPHELVLTTAGNNHKITAISSDDPTAFGEVSINVIEPNTLSKLTIEPTFASIPAGDYGSITIARTDEYDNAISVGDLVVYLFAQEGVFRNAASGGSLINQVTILDGESEVTVWYTHTDMGTFTLTISESKPANGNTGIEDASVDVIVTGSATPFSDNANLANLTTSEGNINPIFDKDVLSYTATVPYSISQFDIRAITEDANASVNINGTLVDSNGDVFNLSLNTGSNTFTITVIAENGDEKIYTLIVTRQSQVSLQVINAEAVSRPYDGTNTVVIINAELEGDIDVDDDIALGNANIGTFAQVGVGTDISVTSDFTLIGADAGKYVITVQPTLTADITAKQLTIADPTLTESKVYDGTTAAAVTAGALSGVAADDVVTLTAVATYDNANVITGKTITVVYTLAGADADNYSAPVNFVSNDGAITAKQLTIADPTLTESKVYDGTSAAAVTAGALSGVAADDVVTVTAVATYDNTNVETGKAITVVYTLAGADADNYSAPVNFVSAFGQITPINLKITADTKSKVEGESDPQLTYQLTSGALLTGDNFSGGLTREPGETAGEYSINQGTLSAGSNYQLTFTSAKLSILSADSDGDGVTDDKDLCPNTPTGESVDANGCSASQKDSDGDGVMDDKDLCPNTPIGASVDANGCSASQKDSDGDGVMDDKDLCPNTPTGESVDANGCSASQKDSDGDGVMDDKDLCPNTPTGESVDANGCSASQKDSDGDGVMDDKDLCPNTPIGEAVDTHGCSDSQKDSDGDSIMDDKDLCPNTPIGASVDANGCSDSQKDSDGDGVMDDKDLCPNTPVGETVDANGCSASQKDSDGDGVMDDKDLCHNTPVGEAVDSNGCSASKKDSDGDGVMDDKDLCPNTPAGESVDANGCSDSQKDSDGDGVMDDKDLCPNTPLGESVDADGCSDSQKDSDGDGVTDDKDLCPNTPTGETVDANGCSASQLEIRIMDVIQPQTIKIAWGNDQFPALIPKEVLAWTSNADYITIPVTWDIQNVNPWKRGVYQVKGNLNLIERMTNPSLFQAEVFVEVLPKVAPTDVILTHANFKVNIYADYFFISDIIVMDVADDIHWVGLAGNDLDNRFFEIRDQKLFWNSNESLPGKESFSIFVQVIDRDGNELTKILHLNRERPRLDQINIYNTFTPNGDGQNDTWGVPELSYFKNARVQVFERSGKRVFYTENSTERWDGTFKEIELATGTYYWTVEVGETGEVRRGMLNLIRK